MHKKIQKIFGHDDVVFEFDTKALKGEDKIIHIAKSLNASHYLNSPGEVSYSRERFEGEGIVLNYLPPYLGSKVSILERLLYEEPQSLEYELNTH